MNIETFSRLIEASDVSVFRSLTTILIPLIGIGGADYCDGPYDGGKDFNLAIIPKSGVKIGIQISVEKKWEAKLRSDALKLQKNYATNVIYFISSRRIPESSYEKIKESLLLGNGITVIKFDNQAIATRFIDNNMVNDALILMGIDTNSTPNEYKKYLGPKNEAVSSLLLFDENTKDLRQRFFQSIIMSVLSRSSAGLSHIDLLDEIKINFSIQDNQFVQVRSNIDRLLQVGKIKSVGNILTLSTYEKDRFLGLKESTELELNYLRNSFHKEVMRLLGNLDSRTNDLLISNFLELTVYLSGKNYSTYDGELKQNEAYVLIRDILSSNFGIEKTSEIFKNLSAFFANSEFAKHIACAKLYDAFLNTKSSHLINALGGTESLNVYIDSSVFIPIICSLLFDKVQDRFSQSGSSLYRLINNHKFKAIVPHDYMEEVASHLIEACRDYKHIIEQDIDLSHSGNAFVSHYSKYKHNNSSITFNEYVKVFGIRLENIHNQMSDDLFYSIRDKVSREITSISSKYDFIIEKLSVDYLESKIEQYREFLYDNKLTRPDVLIRHDARVIGYLSGDYVQSGVVKLLCTWDKVHSIKNPDGNDGYYVMHPIAVIDYFSLAKGNGETSISHLLDFAMMQEETDLELSSKIWDAIARVENENLSDANLLISAKEFKEQYMENHANDDKIASAMIEREWMAWKK